MNDTVRNIKLVTGEELIAFVDYGYVDDQTNKHLTLSKPMQLVMQQRRGEDGTPAFGMAVIPYATYTDDDLVIEQKNVMFDVAPKADLEAYYRKETSPLELPPAGLVIPK